LRFLWSYMFTTFHGCASSASRSVTLAYSHSSASNHTGSHRHSCSGAWPRSI